MKRINKFLLASLSLPLTLALACTDDGTSGDAGPSDTETGDGDGDPTTGDGDGDPTTGDGDGDPTTGDGDGDPTTGDGDGDPTTGDGDGDGDPTTGDGDGDGDPTGGVCGDGVIEGGEECEADDLGGLACTDLGYSGGELACGADCMYDESACTDAVCGDGMVGGAEACDGDELNGATCEGLGYSGGDLVCVDDCTLDESGCFNQECGDGMLTGTEECDGDLLGDMTCGDLGFAGGELLCAADCLFDTAGCNNCGNGVIDDGEVCDGDDVGGETCVNLGYLGGSLSCSDTCDAIIEDACADDWWGDDFEAGNQLGAEWVLMGPAPWAVSNVMPHAGLLNAESGTITHNQTTYMEVTLDFVQDGSVTFWRRVSSETSWDFLRFYVDGVQQGSWSGNLPWTMQMYPITAGQHTLRWAYTKDGSLNGNSDKVWVDDITTVGGLLP